MADRVVSYVFRGDIKGLQASMTAAGHSVAKLGDDLTKADKESARFRKGLTAVGDTAGKIGLVAAAGLGAIVLTTAKFDKQMSQVQAATGETAANMDKLREAAIQAGADTAFSASEAAQGVTELAKAGVSTADVLSGGLAGALDLAAAGQIGVGEAAEFSARAMTQFNLEGSQVPHIADLLAAAAGKAVGEVGDFGQALNQAGLVASQTGLSIEDTVGTLAAFAQAGLQGSDAGTSFKSMLQRLQNPLGQGAKAMESLGINAYDANGNFIGITEVAGQLQEKLGGLTQAQRDAAMAQIFGSDAVRAASILYKEGAEGIQSWIDQTNDAGFAADQAAAKMDNLAGDFEEFTGSLETALIGAGSGSQGMLRDLVQGATDAVNAFNDLPPAAQNTATALLGITAVTGGGLWFGAKVIGGIASTRTALSDLGVTAGQVGRGLRTALAVGAILEGLNLLDQGIDKVFNNDLDTSDLGRSLDALSQGRVTGAVLEQFGGDLEKFGDQASLATSNWTALSRTMNDVPLVGGFVAGTAGDAVDNIEQLDQALASMVESGKQAEAAAVFDQLAAAAAGAGVSMSDVKGLFDQYGIAAANAADGTDAAADSTDDFSGSVASGSSVIRDHTEALQDNIDTMRDQRSEAIRAANAAINYQASLDDARAALKENGKTLDITTEKGRANKTALLGVAAAWNDQSAAAKNAPGAHRAAIGSFVDLAEKMGMGEEKARALAKRILELPDKKVTVTADTSQADSALSLIRRNLLELDGRTARTYVTTVYSQAGFQTRGGLQERATGGSIGGQSPHKRADNILIAATAGEYMHQVDAVDYYGLPAMHAINQRRIPKEILAGYAYGGVIGDIPGYAAGGSVAGTANLRATGDSAAVADLAAATRELAAAQRALAAAEQRNRRFESAREEVEAARATAKSLKSQVASRGDLLRQEQRLRDIRRSLNAGGDRRLGGLDRRVAQAELAEARRELAQMKRSDDRFEAAAKRRDRLTRQLRRHYSGAAAEARKLERAEARLTAARERAAAVEQRSQAIQATGGVFGDGFLDLGSVSARMQRAINNATEFTSLMGQLSAKGTSPFILAQLDQEGPTEGGLVFARQLLKDEAGRRALNAQSARLVQVGISYGRTSLGFSAGWSEQQIARIARDAQVYAPVTVHAPQNMSAQQVGDATAQRIVTKLAGRL
jgi:TP901 family phage tail tape measure protein